MARNVEQTAQRALAYWEKARASDNRVAAPVLYTRGLGCFLSYLHLTDRADVVPTQHAFAAMWREAATMLDRNGVAQRAVEYARAGLAVAHVADPTAGEIERVRSAVETGSSGRVQRVLGEHGRPLTAAMLIGAGAEARALLACLLWKHHLPSGDRWVVGRDGRASYWQDQKRLQRAVLPSCVGMSRTAEMRQLATEAVLIYEELCRVEQDFENPLRQAVTTLARIDGVPL
ncbi:MAG TPA: hypothetical protein VGD48_34720 [Kutzneria sp.]